MEEYILNISSDTVCNIIQSARQFHVKEQVVVPEIPNSPADDWALEMLDDHAGDLNFQEVILIINDLEAD